VGQHFAQAAAQFGDGAGVQVHAEPPLERGFASSSSDLVF